MKLSIVTIGGSITSLEDVDPSWTVLSLKGWVQQKDSVPPHQRHTPPFAYNTDTQLHPDFDRLFCSGTELVEADKTLQQYGVEDGSTMRFALPEIKAADLRVRLYALLEQYPKDSEVANITEEDTRDDRILPFVLDMYLQRRLRKQEANARALEAHRRGEPAAFPAKNPNLLRSDAIQKELLYKLFDPAVVPVRFQILSGGADGNAPYVGLIVEANKTSYKYKTFYGIPVTKTHPNRIKQHSSLQAGSKLRRSPRTNRMIVRRTTGGLSKGGDSNAVWLDGGDGEENRDNEDGEENHTVGIHSSLTVLRIKNNRNDLAVEETERHQSSRPRKRPNNSSDPVSAPIITPSQEAK